MPILLLIAYIVLEVSFLALVISWVGPGWAILALLLSLFGGLALARWQMRRIAIDAQSRGTDAGRALADVGLTAVGALLVALPGLFTALVGLLFILPPTRALLRGLLAGRLKAHVETMGVRGYERSAARFPHTVYGTMRDESDATGNADPAGGSGAGEVIDNDEVERLMRDISPEDFGRPGDDKPRGDD